jgi:hypothetical protein
MNPAVTKRMHLFSIEDFVDSFLSNHNFNEPLDLTDQHDLENFRLWMIRLVENVVFHVAMDFAGAAKAGIDQAATLMQDPDYYETVKKRRRRSKQRDEEYQREQKKEQLRRELLPTKEEIEIEKAQLQRDIERYKNELTRASHRWTILKDLTYDSKTNTTKH